MRLIDADALEGHGQIQIISQGNGAYTEMCVYYQNDIDVAPTVTVQAIPIDVLDKIKAELHTTAEMHEDGDYYLREEWIDEIIDKYKPQESEEI